MSVREREIERERKFYIRNDTSRDRAAPAETSSVTLTLTDKSNGSPYFHQTAFHIFIFYHMQAIWDVYLIK